MQKIILALLTIFTLQPLAAMESDGSKRRRTGESQPTPTSENLLKAAKDGNADECEWLIDQGVDVNTRNRDPLFPLPIDNAEFGSDSTPLITAAAWNHSNTCKLLIKKGATINGQNSKGNTALMVAAEAGHKDIYELLIGEGADERAKNHNESTVLMFAATSGNKDICNLLIRNGADVNAHNIWRTTALMIAAENGHLETCKILIENGANVHAVNSDGVPTLQYAAYNGHDQVCKLLLEHGANPNALGLNGIPTLIDCIRSEDCDDEQAEKCVRILLEFGADVNLLSDGKPIDYRPRPQRQNVGSTALMEAISWGSPALRKSLLQYGVNYEYENNEGESAITRARDVENVEEDDNDHMVALLMNPNRMHQVMITDNPLLQRRFGNDTNNLCKAFENRELLGKK